MASSIAASLRRVTSTAARQSHSQLCRSAIRTTLAPRPFSSCQSPRAEMDTGSQVGMSSQAGQGVEILEGFAHREPPEGDPDTIVEKEWEFDDFSSMAHAELERHREARQYARIMAYEMPRLSELVKPFVPPNEKEILRFRYTTYMGEKHPAQSKVVCEFATSDLPLTKVERNKLIKLVGVRYNPDTDIVRMSSEMFQHQAQNKRYLSDLVDSLIAEAKDSSETFEDIPFDFRHHEAKKAPTKPKFPKEWRLNPERRTQLQEERVNLERMFEQ